MINGSSSSLPFFCSIAAAGANFDANDASNVFGVFVFVCQAASLVNWLKSITFPSATMARTHKS